MQWLHSLEITSSSDWRWNIQYWYFYECDCFLNSACFVWRSLGGLFVCFFHLYSYLQHNYDIFYWIGSHYISVVGICVKSSSLWQFHSWSLVLAANVCGKDNSHLKWVILQGIFLNAFYIWACFPFCLASWSVQDQEVERSQGLLEIAAFTFSVQSPFCIFAAILEPLKCWRR